MKIRSVTILAAASAVVAITILLAVIKTVHEQRFAGSRPATIASAHTPEASNVVASGIVLRGYPPDPEFEIHVNRVLIEKKRLGTLRLGAFNEAVLQGVQIKLPLAAAAERAEQQAPGEISSQPALTTALQALFDLKIFSGRKVSFITMRNVEVGFRKGTAAAACLRCGLLRLGRSSRSLNISEGLELEVPSGVRIEAETGRIDLPTQSLSAPARYQVKFKTRVYSGKKFKVPLSGELERALEELLERLPRPASYDAETH